MTLENGRDVTADGSPLTTMGRVLLSLRLPTLLAALIWFAADYGYLLAHTLAETFSIVVAVTALAVATTAARFTRNHFVVFVSVAIGWCAGLDLVHTLVFKGMGLIASDSSNPATQFWISARFIQASAMLAAPFMLRRSVNVAWLHGVFAIPCVLAVQLIQSGVFPDCFIEGKGLTPFKIYTEYVIIGMLFASVALLWQRRHLTSRRLLWSMTASVLVMMASEFAFTRYVSAYGQANLVGHILKVYAYWFIYLALVRTTVEEPFGLLSRAAGTYDAVPEPTLVIAPSGAILLANQAAALATGVPADQLVGRSSHTLFHDDSLPVESCSVCGRLGASSERFSTLLELPGGRFAECSVTPYAQDSEGRAYVQVLHDITEQHASEERFRKLFEDTRQPTMLVEDGRFVAANRATLEMLRVSDIDGFIGRTPPDISPEHQPDGRRSSEKVLEVIAAAFEKGSNEFEWEHIRADGEHFIARVLLTPIRMRGKDVLHVVWTDITEQKRAEQERAQYRQTLEQRVKERTVELEALAASLRGANAQQQAIFDAASAGIMLIRNRRIEQCNRRLEMLTGYDTGELPGLPTGALYADEAAWREAGQEIYGALGRGESYSKEQVARRKDGSTFWVRLSASAIDPNDLERGIVGMLEDITAQRAALEALHKATEEQQAVFDAATVGVILTHDRVIHRCNRTMERLFGYGPDEMLGRTTRILYSDDATYEDVSRRLVDSLTTQGSFQEEHELVRKDGSRFWSRKMVRTIDRLDPDKGFAGTFEDITTERVALDEMVRARMLAEDAARTKAEFLANMSHEIRTPMNSVIGMTHLALKAEPSPKVRDYIQKIQSSSQHLLGVINDILDFSKLEAGKMALEHADFELDRVLDDLTGVFSEKAAVKGLELLIDVDPDVPLHLVGDLLRIEQVLINLTNNAVKFTERGEVVLKVSTQRLTEDEALLRFSVRDTGIGISDEQRQGLFQSFHQADTSTTRKYGGSGLGLVIAKRLTELMGGEIGLESALGAGSTFWFTARLGIGHGTAVRRQGLTDFHGRRVLVVDDNEQARLVSVDMLRNMGLDAAAVEDGPRALEEIEGADAAGNAFDIVILDWKMPGMDGVEVARQIRRRPLKNRPMLLMITAFDRDEVLPEAEEVGIGQVLVKPLTPSALFNAVMRQFGMAVEDATPASASSGTDLLKEDPRLLGARALLVEDNTLNQEVAIEFLRALGLEVDLAEDGAIALEKVQQRDYDVVLMDMQMPVMDGVASTRAIRKLPGFAELPILAMTANAMAGDRERCLAAGMNDHIAKPIVPQDLLTKLLKWVAGDSDRAPRQVTSAPAHTGTTDAPLPRIAGVDVAAGLARVLGRQTLYRSLLSKFVDGQKDAAQRIDNATSAALWDVAEREAHTLKGVSAQIGAVAMRDLAERMEHSIRRRDPVASLAPLQADVARTLSGLVASIDTALREPAPQPPPGPQERKNWDALRARLLALLADDDLESVQLFEDNRALAQACVGERFAALARAFERMDLAAALEELQASD